MQKTKKESVLRKKQKLLKELNDLQKDVDKLRKWALDFIRDEYGDEAATRIATRKKGTPKVSGNLKK